MAGVCGQVTGGELFDRILAKDHYSETEAARCFVQVYTATSREGSPTFRLPTHVPTY